MPLDTLYAPYQWQIPEYLNIAEACLNHSNGEKTAMVFDNEQAVVRTLTYKQLLLAVQRFSRAIQQLHLPPQSRNLIILPNIAQYPVFFLGTIYAGLVATPSSMLLTADEIAYVAKDSGASILCCEYAKWAQLAKVLNDIPGLKYIILVGEGKMPQSDGYHEFFDFAELQANSQQQAMPAKTHCNDPAYLVYTSGTTGYPKGVLHAQRSLIGRLPSGDYWFPFAEGRDEKILHSGKFNWTYVLGTGLMDPLYHGHTIVVYEGKNEANTWLNLIKKHKCTIFIGVPTIYRQILQKTDATINDVPTLRHCMSAGEHLPDYVFAEWKTRFRQNIYEAIGMSEFSYYISHSIYRTPRPGSAGLPQPGHEIELIDENFQPVPVNTEGMIAIPLDDPGLFLRYWGLPDEDVHLRRNGYFLTGDFAYRDSDGYIWFLGRKDDVINTFGFRVSPHEIERVYKNHKAIADCVAAGERISKGKILPVIFVILKDTNNEIPPQELIEYGLKYLADYKRPKKVYFVEQFTRTKNGKVSRAELKKQLESHKGNN